MLFRFLAAEVEEGTFDDAVLALALFGPGLDLAFDTGVVLLEIRIEKCGVKQQPRIL